MSAFRKQPESVARERAYVPRVPVIVTVPLPGNVRGFWHPTQGGWFRATAEEIRRHGRTEVPLQKMTEMAGEVLFDGQVEELIESLEAIRREAHRGDGTESAHEEEPVGDLTLEVNKTLEVLAAVARDETRAPGDRLRTIATFARVLGSVAFE